jgi:hypothetical protein
MDFKKEFGEYTLNSEEMKKGLEFIPKYIPVMVVGGVAVQLYCKNYFPKDEKLLRPTNDIDFLPEYAGFISKPSLSEIGAKFNLDIESKNSGEYFVVHSKNRGGYEIALYDLDEKYSPIFFHLSTFSKGYWNKHYEEKFREISNGVKISNEKSSLKVHKLEDLIVNKTKRLNYLDTAGLLSEEESTKLSNIRSGKIESAYLNFDPDSKLEEFIELRRKNLNNENEPRDLNKETPTYLEETKIMKDFYDLGIIGMIFQEKKEKFDEVYFSKSMTMLNK